MSVHALNWAKTQKTGSPSRKLVLMAIADYADENGRAWPSQRRIAEECEISDRTVRRALEELEEGGFIKRTERHRADGSQTSDQITLALATISTDVDSQPADRMPTPPENSSTPPVREPSPQDMVSAPPDNLSAPPVTMSGLTTFDPSLKDLSSDFSKSPPKTADLFECFWRAYPRRDAKKPALQRFEAALRRGVDPGLIIRAAEREAAKSASRPAADRKFIPMAKTWLNEERWESDDPSGDAPSDAPGTIRPDQWREFVGLWIAERYWPPVLGPEPGQPDCHVPPDILAEMVPRAPARTQRQGANSPGERITATEGLPL